MSVVVVGASGAVGGAVVAGLLQQGVQVVATSRQPQRLALPEQVRTVAADFNDPGSFSSALAGARQLFLYADLDHPEAFLQTVVAAGVEHVVLLSSSAVTFRDAADDFNAGRFLRVEGAIKASGLQYTFLRPGGFASNAARWSYSIKAAGVVPLPYPEAVQTPIHEHDIADVAVAALTGKIPAGQAPVLTGPQRLTLREQVDTIADVIGRPLSVVQQTEEESSTMLSQHLPAVWVRQILKDWRQAVDTTPAISQETTRITGRPARTFASWVSDHAHLFA